MAGEMHRSEVVRESYPMHFAIADAMGGTVEPFDHYQGPYIHVGRARLWVCSEDGEACFVYNENSERKSELFLLFYDEFDCLNAVSAAEEVIK